MDLFLNFVDNVFTYLFGKAQNQNGWDYYNSFIIVLIDMIEQCEWTLSHSYLHFLQRQLVKIAPYIDMTGKADYYSGYALSASKTWCSSKKKIPSSFIEYINKSSLNEYDKAMLNKLFEIKVS